MAPYERLNLTERQFAVYARRFVGQTQEEVARDLGICQQRVSQHEARAIKRNPNLPPIPEHCGRRTTNMSALGNEYGTGLANVLGLVA